MVSKKVIGAGILAGGLLLFFTGATSGKQQFVGGGGGASGVLEVIDLRGSVASAPTKKSETSLEPTTIIIEAETITSPFGNGQTKKEVSVSNGTTSFIDDKPITTTKKAKISTKDLIVGAPIIIQKQILEKLPRFNFRQAFNTITFGRFT